MYYKNDSSTRGRHRIHVARPFESNKVECAERAISKLTLASRRKPSLAHTPCAEFIVMGVFDRGRIKGKKNRGGAVLSFSHATVGASDLSLRSVVTTAFYSVRKLLTPWGTLRNVYDDTASAVTGECSGGEVGVRPTRVETIAISACSSTSANR